jgi:hypothetical protein
MLQIFAMIFFSIAAVAAIGVMLATVADGWEAVKRALGLDTRTAPLPKPLPVRFRTVRTSPQLVPRPVLRAAA